ncbi:hypothetical protein F5Y09DRAFT_319569 [Xylaria sp. FL1042]|nr:hypothetical protein F5Y09DRAFT_319569 [Xylaria sp. FL1042]
MAKGRRDLISGCSHLIMCYTWKVDVVALQLVCGIVFPILCLGVREIKTVDFRLSNPAYIPTLLSCKICIISMLVKALHYRGF